MKTAFTLAAVGLATIGSVALAAAPAIQRWDIGPNIRGKNYSVGMPSSPTPTRNGWYFDFPYPNRSAGHVHYVSFAPESLVGKSKLIMRYRVTGARGVRFVPQEHQDLPGTVSLYFQRGGDSWSARGRYEFYRWYAPANTIQRIAPGVHQMTVDLNDPAWISVMGRTTDVNPAAFADAKRNASKIGLNFGSTSARGHGVFSTAPARFELFDFRIE